MYVEVDDGCPLKIQMPEVESGKEGVNVKPKCRSEVSLLEDFLVALDVVANGKVGPAIEADTTFRVFAHLCYVLLDVL